MGEVLVRREREMLWASRGHRLFVPEGDVPERAMPVPVQCVCPCYARGGKLVCGLIESPADSLPCQPPTVLLDVREGLFHLKVKCELSKSRAASAVAYGAQVVPSNSRCRGRYSGPGKET